MYVVHSDFSNFLRSLCISLFCYLHFPYNSTIPFQMCTCVIIWIRVFEDSVKKLINADLMLIFTFFQHTNFDNMVAWYICYNRWVKIDIVAKPIIYIRIDLLCCIFCGYDKLTMSSIHYPSITQHSAQVTAPFLTSCTVRPKKESCCDCHHWVSFLFLDFRHSKILHSDMSLLFFLMA